MIFVSPLGRGFHTYPVKAPTEPLSVTHSFRGSPETIIRSPAFAEGL